MTDSVSSRTQLAEKRLKEGVALATCLGLLPDLAEVSEPIYIRRRKYILRMVRTFARNLNAQSAEFIRLDLLFKAYENSFVAGMDKKTHVYYFELMCHEAFSTCSSSLHLLHSGPPRGPEIEYVPQSQSLDPARQDYYDRNEEE